MEYTIQEMTARKGRSLEETDYFHSPPDMLNFRLISGDFYKWNGGKLRFKECVDVMDFEQAAAVFPPLEAVQYRSREKFPYFAGGLDTLAAAVESGESVAVEGGPCLFGEYEVTVSVRLKSGETRLFDYANGKGYLEGTDFEETDGLADYLRGNGAQVTEIGFRQDKWDLTPQEYLNLLYPFEIAAALGGPLVIPIPDMSYRKYLLYALDAVSEDIRKQALEEFDGILNRIADIYLETIAKLQDRFQIQRFACVHRRAPAALERWYERRGLYIERGKVLRSLTRLPEKIEPIKDYISMPALPFYLFNERNLLQVDSVDETDSYRKCRKAHKNALRMGCILLPELLSGDGVHTLYNAPLQWKAYGNYKILEKSELGGGG